MRRSLFGILVPLGILVFTIHARLGHNWQPHETVWAWAIWLGSVIVTSAMLGAGLKDYWGHGGHREDAPREHHQIRRRRDALALFYRAHAPRRR